MCDDEWGRTVARPKTLENPIPHYFLYGDGDGDLGLDSVHVEPIKERSMRHDWIIHPHLHPEHVQVLFVTDGGASIQIEGITLEVGPNNLVVQPAGMIHEIRFLPGTEGIVITVAISYVDAVAGHDPRLVDVTKHPAVFDVTPSPGLADVATWSFETLRAEVGQSAPGRRTMMRSALLNILVTLVRLQVDHALDAPRLRDRDYDVVTRFRDLLDRYFGTEKSLTFYAKNLGVSVQRLNLACKARASKTASEVLHDRILVEAKRHLLYTEMTVAEIGHALGYDDPAYFNRFFSHRVGHPPGEFRAQHSATQRVIGP